MKTAEAMVAAVKARDLAKVQELLDRDPGLADTPTEDGSLILTAIYYGAREIVDLLLEKGAAVNLFEAAALGDSARLAEILAAAPDLVNTHNAGGYTPLGLAAYFGTRAAAEVLLARGADLHLRSRPKVSYVPENTPLHAALAGRNWEVAELLVASGADVNSLDSSGWSPLHHAAYGGNKDMVALLLAHGAEVNGKERNGRTPLATEKGRQEVAELLRRHGAAE